MELDFHFETLFFSGGEEVQVEPNSLTLITGANNSGKSRALRDISSHYRAQGEAEAQVVKTAAPHYPTPPGARLEEWLDAHYGFTNHSALHGARYVSVGKRTQVHVGPGKQANFSLDVGPFIILQLDAESRLTSSNGPPRVDPINEPHEHFIHSLQVDTVAFELLRQEVRSAFNLGIAIDYFGGARIPLYVGKEPRVDQNRDRVSLEYASEMRRTMVPLQEAGDGVRSYVVTLASVLVSPHPVILIDEPEAFLHPPQALRLGRALAKFAVERKRQIIAATHSSEVVRGALTARGSVAVCRINRDGGTPEGSVNHGHLLNTLELKALWEKPLLRSSHAIGGIFHRGVVVCESDGDARFYESLTQRLEATGVLSEPPDIHFVHGGGKGELKTLAESYKTLRVPVAVVADFDVLRDERELARIVVALGREWEPFANDYKVAASALADVPPNRGEESALREVERIVAEASARTVSPEEPRIKASDRRRIYEALSDSKDWSGAKRYGIEKISGQQRQAGDRLLVGLEKVGLFVVPRGELESWDRSLSTGRKERWIREALTKLADDSDSFSEASSFIERVVRYINSGAAFERLGPSQLLRANP